MIASLVTVWGIVAILSLLVWRRAGMEGLTGSGQGAVTQFKGLMFRLPLALLMASFLVRIIPMEAMSATIGPQSGLSGILIATLIGGVLPGGPMTSFPIAIIFLQGGAGTPQLVSLIAGWSVFALHRLLAYEAPIMGWRFVALRFLSSMTLPVLAGLLAQAVVLATTSP